jgi:putative endonuclease
VTEAPGTRSRARHHQFRNRPCSGFESLPPSQKSHSLRPANFVSPKRRSREGGLQFLHSNPDRSDAETAHLLDTSETYQHLALAGLLPCPCMRGTGNRFVYVLRSDVDSARHYVGTTSDADQRLEWHNHEPCGHTVSYRPWSVLVSLEFPDEQSAVRFEKYLKSGSGRAFVKRHFAR